MIYEWSNILGMSLVVMDISMYKSYNGYTLDGDREMNEPSPQTVATSLNDQWPSRSAGMRLPYGNLTWQWERNCQLNELVPFDHVLIEIEIETYPPAISCHIGIPRRTSFAYLFNFRSTEICSSTLPFATSLARQMQHKARWGWLVAEASLPLPRLPWQLVLWGNYCIDIFTQEVEHKVDRYTSPMFFLMVAPPPFSTNWLSQASWRSSPVTLAATAFEAS